MSAADREGLAEAWGEGDRPVRAAARGDAVPRTRGDAGGRRGAAGAFRQYFYDAKSAAILSSSFLISA